MLRIVKSLLEAVERDRAENKSNCEAEMGLSMRLVNGRVLVEAGCGLPSRSSSARRVEMKKLTT